MNKLFLLLILFLAASLSVFAQKHLYGKWKAECVFERNDDGSLTSCTICPLEYGNDKSTVKILPLNLVINKNEIIISYNNVSEKVSYEYDDKNETIKFDYKNNSYAFRVLINQHKKVKILKTRGSGCLLLLTR